MVQTQEEMMDLLTRLEQLDPELEPYMEEGVMGRMLRHPLVYSLCHDPARSGLANAQLKWKKERLAEARREEDWHTYVYLHERPYRLDAFSDICWDLAGGDYWELLGDIWVDSENIYQSRDQWREMLESDEPEREYMSSEKDRVVFSLSPEQGGLLPMTTIYRGYQYDDGLDGFSWTLDKARAKWFAKRFLHRGETPTVAVGTVAREHVLAYHTGRDEQEIVVLPENVNVIGINEIEEEDDKRPPGKG